MVQSGFSTAKGLRATGLGSRSSSILQFSPVKYTSIGVAGPMLRVVHRSQKVLAAKMESLFVDSLKVGRLMTVLLCVEWPPSNGKKGTLHVINIVGMRRL